MYMYVHITRVVHDLRGEKEQFSFFSLSFLLLFSSLLLSFPLLFPPSLITLINPHHVKIAGIPITTAVHCTSTHVVI